MPLPWPRWWSNPWRRRWAIAAVALIALLAAVVIASFRLDEPLRRYTEAKMNAALAGYAVTLGKAHFQPLGFSLTLQDLVIVQNGHPDPPVAEIPRLKASVHWRALLKGRVVGDIGIYRPTVHINLAQVRREIHDPTPLADHGWRQALEAIYPLKIDHFVVQDGDITYRDEGPFKPLRVRRVELEADDLRNRKPPPGVYPSPFTLSAAVFDSGHVSAEGRADFLAPRQVALEAHVALERIDLDYVKPITNRVNLAVEKGRLSAVGRVVYTADVRSLALERASIEGMRVDYIHTAQTAQAEQQRAGQVAAAARKVSNAPDTLLTIDRLDIVKSTFGYADQSKNPPYRVFVSDVDLTVTNFSNQDAQGTTSAKLAGKFMGSGATAVEASFRPEHQGPDMNVAVRIEDTSLPAMNDLLRAYGKFDVAAGSFSFYSELHIKDQQITGYVKPLFRDLKVYDAEQDKDKSIFQKMYEGMVGGVAKLLKNHSRKEVATRAEISGRTDNPKVSTMEVVARLFQNAFFQAILPGFELDRDRGSPRA